jgi:hypothetical protein
VVKKRAKCGFVDKTIPDKEPIDGFTIRLLCGHRIIPADLKKTDEAGIRK